MKFRSTTIYLTLAVGLGLFVYFYEIRGGREREEARENEKKLLQVEEAAIDSIEIIRPGKEKLRMEMTESGSWAIIEPLKARASLSTIDSIKYQLSDLSYSQIVDESPADLGPFGLVTPEIELIFNADEKTHTLLFGADTPMGFDTYLQVKGEKRVVSVSRSARQSMDKYAADFRDKHIVAFDQMDLFGLEIVTGEYKISFERKKEDWRIISPREVDADDDILQGLVDQLSTIEADEFVPDVVVKAQGLDDPIMEMTLLLGEKERARKKITFRITADGKNALAHPEGELWHYIIPTTLIGDSVKPVDYFREINLLKFDRFDLKEMVVRGDQKAAPVVLRKDDKGDWNIAEPESAKGKALPSNVYDLIETLETLEAAEFVDDPPPESETGLTGEPAVVLFTKEGEGSEKKEAARLYLGKKNKDGFIYARGSGPQVFLIGGDFVLPKSPGDFSKKKIERQPGAFTEMPDFLESDEP